MIAKKGDPTSIKIIDFGFATILEEGHYLTKTLGTMSYISPEICHGWKYDSKSDIWALGITAYVLLAGAFPFDGESSREILQSIKFETLFFQPQ